MVIIGIGFGVMLNIELQEGALRWNSIGFLWERAGGVGGNRIQDPET